MSKSYSGYPTYAQIEDPKIRAWNRCATFYNIMQDRSRQEAESYIQQFNDFDKAHIRNLTREIKERGYTTVRRDIISSKSIH